jgi:quinoprotein glucose dehydrogenase
MIHEIKLFPAASYDAVKASKGAAEIARMAGAPYGMTREAVLSPIGMPCNPTPWGVLAAVDLKEGKILWEKTLGTTEELAPLGLAMAWGTPTLGGPVSTGGGVVFIGGTLDRYLRAFDSSSGAELWAGRLPAAAAATPMVYEWQGRQFVVIAAGGHSDVPVSKGDSFVAFSLPGSGESGPSLWSRTIDQPGGRFWATLILAVGFLSALLIWWRWLKFRLW